jgi:PAS domain-containing protein
LRYAVSCAEDSDDTIRNSTTERPNQAWTEEGFHCRQQWLGGIPGIAGAIEIEQWRGLAVLDRPGPLQDNRGKRAKEESAHGCGFISTSSFSAMKPPEDNERIMIDSMPVMAWRCRPDGFVEFFNRRWLEYTGLSLDQALGWGWTVAIHADDLNRCEHSISEVA